MPCTDPQLNSRFVDLLLEHIQLRAKLLGHQEASRDGCVSTTNTQVATDTFALPEVQHIGREEETWGEEGDVEESRDVDGEAPPCLVIGGSEESESTRQRSDSSVAEQQSWPVVSLLTLSNDPKPQNEDPKPWNDDPKPQSENPKPQNENSKRQNADPNPSPWTEEEPVPIADTTPCTPHCSQQANGSSSTVDQLPSLQHHFSVATSIPLHSGPAPLPTSPSGSAINDISVHPEALQATLASTAGSRPAPPLLFVNSPRSNTYPSQASTATGHHLPPFHPTAIVQPWVDASCSGSKRLRHHPFSSGSSQAQHSSAGYFNHQYDLTVGDQPQATCGATSAGRSRNKDPPSRRARRFLRFRPYQPTSEGPLGAGGAERHTGRHHSARNYRLTIHPPLTASDFPQSPPLPRRRSYLADSSGNCASPSEHRFCNGAHLPPHSPPPPWPYSEHPFPHMQQPSPSLPSTSHPPYPPYPPPQPLQTQSATVWRPYSERPRCSGFCLADIISLPPSEVGGDGGLAPPPVPPPPATNSGRIPSFLVDHLLDDSI